MTDLTNPIFQDADKAREFLEAQRWADGVTCPHCGETESIRSLKGKSHRPGLYQCNSCRNQFTVTVGTVFERSKVPLNKWLLATYLLSSSKKGMSAHQLHRTIGVTYKTAWFMFHRIREAMRKGELAAVGGAGSVVEIDETYIGNKRKKGHTVTPLGRVVKERSYHHKHVVLSLVERGGDVRSFHIDRANADTIRPIVVKNVSRESRLNTDFASFYVNMGREFKGGHARLNHTVGEYARGKDHTNTIEGYFSIFKRGMRGIYQHCGEQHLHRYLAEFDFRYNGRGLTDWERTQEALKGIEGKRLSYRRPSEAANA